MDMVERPGVRRGYDLWSDTYDETLNPVIAMDGRVTMSTFAPTTGERLLDAPCGTGRHLVEMARCASQPVGIDLSPGMLKVSHAKFPRLPLVQADLEKYLPFRPSTFRGVLCALVGEHIENLSSLFREFHRVLDRRGRLVFSVFHPELAAAGVEPNFERDGQEYRLGAFRHTLPDYFRGIDEAGFRGVECVEYRGDEELVGAVPQASKYLGRPLLVVISAWKAGR
jgi:ubiquinone/menaquinone biosynthesis C-methylase UbiE